jgi:NhaP-type Na+/H+ or K+/H+ antiporter
LQESLNMTTEQWPLTKSVPLTFIFAILLQTMTLVWFIANLNSNVEDNAREIVRHETRIQSLETAVQSQAVAVARMDENIQAIRSMIENLVREQTSR